MHIKTPVRKSVFGMLLLLLLAFTSVFSVSASSTFSDVKESDYFYQPVRWAVDKGMCQGTGSGKFSPSNPSARAFICYYLWVYKGSPAVSGTSPFTDLGSLDPAIKKAVDWAYSKNIVDGITNTAFKPMNTITRGQLISVLWRAEGSPKVSQSASFSDVGKNKYYSQAVAWAVNKGVAAGTSATTFSPNKTCTKAQVLTFLYKMAGSPYGAKTVTNTVGLTQAKAAASSTAAVTKTSTTKSSARDSGGPTGMSEANYKVLTNVIGAVESGGQVYGQRDYSCYAGSYTNSPKEYTCTLGWCQFYGDEAKALIERIKSADPATFASIDKKGLIANKLGSDWVAEKWNPNGEEKNVLIALITSAAGKAQQDAMFRELTTPFVTECSKNYTSNTKAIMMYCEIRHLGGKKAVDRIFTRCAGNYTLDNILASLKKDQSDASSTNQVGDALFNTRHAKCAAFIEKYTVG